MIDIDLIAATRAACLSGEARRIRRRAGVSQSEVAAACGVVPSSVAGWERGLHLPLSRAAQRYGQVLVRLRGVDGSVAA